MKIPESIKTKLYEFSKSDIKIKIAVAAGLIGILIIFLSTLVKALLLAGLGCRHQPDKCEKANRYAAGCFANKGLYRNTRYTPGLKCLSAAGRGRIGGKQKAPALGSGQWGGLPIGRPAVWPAAFAG